MKMKTVFRLYAYHGKSQYNMKMISISRAVREGLAPAVRVRSISRVFKFCYRIPSQMR